MLASYEAPSASKRGLKTKQHNEPSPVRETESDEITGSEEASGYVRRKQRNLNSDYRAERGILHSISTVFNLHCSAN